MIVTIGVSNVFALPLAVVSAGSNSVPIHVGPIVVMIEWGVSR